MITSAARSGLSSGLVRHRPARCSRVRGEHNGALQRTGWTRADPQVRPLKARDPQGSGGSNPSASARSRGCGPPIARRYVRGGEVALSAGCREGRGAGSVPGCVPGARCGGTRDRSTPGRRAPRVRAASRSGALAEELTDREMSILRALTGSATQREIGAALFLSVNTVKAYNRSLHRTLDVQDAVRAARRLGLI
ncbi:response regulator transcription factor [Pseudonocardia saturnea]